MATVNPTRLTETMEAGVEGWKWVLTSANADGAPVKLPQHADCTWHLVTGAAGGATCALQGSNEGSTYTDLLNAFTGNAATATASAMITTGQRPKFLRPNLTTPGTDGEWTVTLLMRKNIAFTK